jgi:hypothetical protein
MQNNYIKICKKCGCNKYEKGRAHDSRRAYRCLSCKNIWTEGMQGRRKQFSIQRLGFQFKDKTL